MQKSLQPPATTSILSPYLTGFEFSRPDNSNESSIKRPQPAPLGPNAPPPLADPYLHPSVALPSPAKSTRVTDIYALGVLLFKIGI